MSATSFAAEPTKLRTYFGTYTGKESKGIYVSELDLKTGVLKPIELAAELVSPSFLAVHPNGKYIVAVGEIDNFGGKKTGGLTSLAIDPKSGKLTQINQQSSQGTGPCHVSIDKTGQCVMVANYGGGSIAAYPIDPATGKIGEATSAIQHEGSSADKGRQEAPHAHSINVDPANRFAFAADLGLDKILIYKLVPAQGKLASNDPPFVSVKPGNGPRHFAFHPTGKFAYVCNEMTSGITAFAYDADKGSLTELQTLSTLPADYNKPGNSTAEIQVHPSGKFAYVSNRGHDSLAIFAIDQVTGKLTAVGHQSTGGKTPRNFGIDPTGQYIVACNQSTNDVQVLKVDQATGKLTPVGEKISVPSPVCVKFTTVGE
ncbi:MAG TPA: lactonase family protein [Pirellulaceae bacterium]|nr:lactonase family protein [Pirellulaceae bacterium]